MKKLTLITIAVLLSVTSTLYARTYTATVAPWAAAEVLWVAKDKGFFKRENIDMELKIYATIPDWSRAIASGRYDFHHTWTANVCEFWAGKTETPVIIGSTSHDQGFASIIAKKGVTGKKLKGQKIGVEYDSGAYKYIMYKYLNRFGLTLSDIKVVMLANNDLLSNFLRGRLKVIVATGNSINKSITEGNGVILTSTKEHYAATINNIWIPAKRFKTIPKEDIKKWWRAIFSAKEWMFDPKNEEELRKIVTKRLHMVPELVHAYSSNANLKEYRKNSFKEYLPQENRFYSMKIFKVIPEIVELRKQSGLSHNFKFEERVDMSAMEEVLMEWEPSHFSFMYH